MLVLFPPCMYVFDLLLSFLLLYCPRLWLFVLLLLSSSSPRRCARWWDGGHKLRAQDNRRRRNQKAVRGWKIASLLHGGLEWAARVMRRDKAARI